MSFPNFGVSGLWKSIFPQCLQKCWGLAAGHLQGQTLSTEDTSVSSGRRALSRRGVRVTMVVLRMRDQALILLLFPRPHTSPPGGVMTKTEFLASPGEERRGVRA